MKKLIIFLILIMISTIILVMQAFAADTMNVIGDVYDIRNGSAQVEILLGTISKQLIIAGYNNKSLKTVASIDIEAGEGYKTVNVPSFSKDISLKPYDY